MDAALLSNLSPQLSRHISCSVPYFLGKLLINWIRLIELFFGEKLLRRKNITFLNEKQSRPKDERGLGIKNSKCRNKSLLTKRAWDLLLGSNETWANVLRHKYTPIRSSSRRRSLIRKSLCHTKDICEKGKGWLIRNDKTINFWQDN